MGYNSYDNFQVGLYTARVDTSVSNGLIQTPQQQGHNSMEYFDEFLKFPLQDAQLCIRRKLSVLFKFFQGWVINDRDKVFHFELCRPQIVQILYETLVLFLFPTVVL